MRPRARSLALLAASVILFAPLSCGKKPADGELNLQTYREEARRRQPSDVEIPWVGGDTLSKTRAIKLVGRQARNMHKPDVAERLGTLANRLVTYGDSELLAMGWFYLALLKSQDIPARASKEEVFQMVREAVELGYRSHFELQKVKPLLEDPKYKKLIRELQSEYEEQWRKDYPRLVDQGFKIGRETDVPSWEPGLTTLDGKPLLESGRPALLVVSRIHHDGFNKYLPLIHEIRRKYGGSVPMAVVFHQYDAKDPARLQQTADYIEERAIELPVAVAGREAHRKLLSLLETRHNAIEAKTGGKDNPFNPYEPLSLFLSAERKPLFLERGALADWQIDYAVKKFIEVTGAGDEGNDEGSEEKGEEEGQAAAAEKGKEEAGEKAEGGQDEPPSRR